MQPYRVDIRVQGVKATELLLQSGVMEYRTLTMSGMYFSDETRNVYRISGVIQQSEWIKFLVTLALDEVRGNIITLTCSTV